MFFGNMKKENLLYLTIILSILAVRLVAFLYPKHLIIFGLLIHHFWTGVLLMTISLLLLRKQKNFNFIIFGIGFGLVLDELGFMILGAGSFPEYWALPSVISAVFFLIISYIFKDRIYKIVR